MTTQEFEKQTLEKLLNELKDIDNYKSFRKGAFVYDLGHYQGQLLLEEINRLNNIIDGLEKWLKEDLKQQYRDCGHRNSIIREVYNKLNELKGDNK